MDPFKLLKTDHQKVAALFKKIEDASAGTSKKELFTQLKNELDLHSHVEEKFLYPALENKEESREITLEAYEEHNVVKDLLAELATQSPDDAWDAKLTVLKENVEHHVEEEEGELFSKARNVLTKEQLERLEVEMEGEKAARAGERVEPAASSMKGRAKSTRKAPAKSSSAKKKESPGVLARLANFVGLTANPAPTTKKSASRKTPAKKTATRKKSSGVTRKAVKKSAAKSTSQSTARKITKRPSAKKATKKGGSRASKKSAAKKR